MPVKRVAGWGGASSNWVTSAVVVLIDRTRLDWVIAATVVPLDEMVCSRMGSDSALRGRELRLAKSAMEIWLFALRYVRVLPSRARVGLEPGKSGWSVPVAMSIMRISNGASLVS